MRYSIFETPVHCEARGMYLTVAKCLEQYVHNNIGVTRRGRVSRCVGCKRGRELREQVAREA